MKICAAATFLVASSCFASSQAPEVAAAIVYLANPNCSELKCRAENDTSVELRTRVETNGIPRNIRIEKSSGNAFLDDATVSAVARSGFLPALTADGVAVASEIVVTYRFKAR